MSDNILVICAHDDDFLISGGGSMLKYLEEGKNIIQVIFSKGEKSHPHLKPSVIAETRKKETISIANKIGIKEVIYFDLEDAKLNTKITPRIKTKLKKIIQKYKPIKIFSVSDKDTHPDHRAVCKAVLEISDSLNNKYPIYTFQVWNIFTENLPLLQENVSKYFKKKIKLMQEHKSQWFSVYLQLIPIYLKGILNGLKHNCRYAEVFYKVR